MVLAGCQIAARAAGNGLACDGPVSLPRTVSVASDVDRRIVLDAMAQWNDFYGNVFIEVASSSFADVKIVSDRSTWVEMPCGRKETIVHAGRDVDLSYWLTHELGHALGLADHIRSSDDASRYINPGFCPGDGYEGVMSYCTSSDRWFGPDDLAMVERLFPRHPSPLPNKTIFVGLALN
jgi:hypothetical protein